MNVLPKLFTKNQADSERMEGLLAVPALMKLGLYLDLRKNAVSVCIYTLEWSADSRHSSHCGMTSPSSSYRIPMLAS